MGVDGKGGNEDGDNYGYPQRNDRDKSYPNSYHNSPYSNQPQASVQIMSADPTITTTVHTTQNGQNGQNGQIQTTFDEDSSEFAAIVADIIQGEYVDTIHIVDFDLITNEMQEEYVENGSIVSQKGRKNGDHNWKNGDQNDNFDQNEPNFGHNGPNSHTQITSKPNPSLLDFLDPNDLLEPCMIIFNPDFDYQSLVPKQTSKWNQHRKWTPQEWRFALQFYSSSPQTQSIVLSQHPTEPFHRMFQNMTLFHGAMDDFLTDVEAHSGSLTIFKQYFYNHFPTTTLSHPLQYHNLRRAPSIYHHQHWPINIWYYRNHPQ